MKLRALHGTGLIIAIVLTALLLTGAVYAGIRFAPDFIQLLNKRTNEQGRTEYSVPAFAQCQNTPGPKTDTFAVKPGANLSDEEVKKILQAKCELQSIDTFASQTWPTYGEHKEWRNGDTIYYTRPDILGTVKNVDKHTLTIEYSGGVEVSKTYHTFQNQDLLAYSRNEQLPLSAIKSGDFVFVIERVGAKYITPMTGKEDPNDLSPHGLGAIAVVKMSLPKAYYEGGKQDHIYEVEPCMHNPGETCPKEHPSGIDVFPRGSEGAMNPDLRTDTNLTDGREINGVVTEIAADKFTIKSNKGHTFTVHLSKQIVDNYNNQAAPLYQENGRFELSKVSLHVGSWVSVTYQQKGSDNPREVLLPDIFKIFLLTDLPRK